MSIDTLVSWIERHVYWRRVWQSRLLGCTVGLLRLVAWTLDSPVAEQIVGHGPDGSLIFGPSPWDERARCAYAMWYARYWYAWEGRR